MAVIQSQQVIIDGKEVDLAVKSKIAINYQSVQIGEVESLNADFTRNIKLANSEKNHDVLRRANKIGAESLAYSKIDTDIFVNGVPVIINGSTVLQQHTDLDGYVINVYGGNFDLFTILRDKSLRELDLSAYDYTWTSQLVYDQNVTQTVTSGVIHPVVETMENPGMTAPYDNSGANKAKGEPFDNWTIGGEIQILNLPPTGPAFAPVYTERLLPWIFKKTLFEEIFTQAGFQLSGALLDEPAFKDSIVTMLPPGEGAFPFEDNQDVVVSNWQHDISQIEFVKSVLTQYNAFVIVEGATAHIIRFKEVLGQQGNAYDWTSKFEGQRSLRFETGYAIRNIVKHATEDEMLNATNIDLVLRPRYAAGEYRYPDGIMTSENKNLAAEKVISELVFANSAQIAARIYSNTGGDPIGDFDGFFETLQVPCLSIDQRSEGPLGVGNQGVVGEVRYTKEFNMRDGIIDYKRTENPTTGFVGTVKWINGRGGANVDSIFWSFNRSSFRVAAVYFGRQAEARNFLGNIQPGDIPEIAKDYRQESDYLVSEYWFEFSDLIIRRPVAVKALFNLSALDVGNYRNDQTNGVIRPVFIEGLGGYWYVSKINNFVQGELTEVELYKL